MAANAEVNSGDANGDGRVDSRDLILLRQYLANYDYDTGVSSIELGGEADIDGDGRVTSKDICALRSRIVNGGTVIVENDGVASVVGENGLISRYWQTYPAVLLRYVHQ